MKANEVIRMRRKELKMTLKEVANAVGVGEATVSRWESGDIKSMKRGNIEKLARALDIPPTVLLDWESYDEERIRRNQLVSDLTTLASVSEINHIEICYNLLKQLEGKE